MKLQKIIQKATSAKAKVGVSAYLLVSQLATNTVFATELADAEAKGANIAQKSIEMVMTFFPWIGAFFVVAGALKLVMAYRNDNNPEAQASAAKDIVIGAVLITFKILWSTFLADAVFA